MLRRGVVESIPADVWYSLSLHDQSFLLLVERYATGRIDEAEFRMCREHLRQMEEIWLTTSGSAR